MLSFDILIFSICAATTMAAPTAAPLDTSPTIGSNAQQNLASHNNSVSQRPPFMDSSAVAAISKFLTSDVASGVSSVAFTSNTTAFSHQLLPLSFWTKADYFGDYVCKSGVTASGAAPDCTVTDTFNPQSNGIGPNQGIGGDLQLERINTFGTDIYDAACWQIAMSLLSVNGFHSVPSASSQSLLLQNGDYADVSVPSPNSMRAFTQSSGTFSYNGKNLSPSTGYTSGTQVLAFRMWPKAYLSTDVFVGTKWSNYLTGAGQVSWMDFKPIMGENAWAFFLGPLQSSNIKSVQCSAGTPELTNAIGLIPAVMAMQSPIGAVYYSTGGSLGNSGSDTVDPYTVSVENNASLLAGLKVLLKMLGSMGTSSGCSIDPVVFKNAVANLNTLIYGGWNWMQGYQTEGILSFFKNHAYDPTRNLMVTSGFANKPAMGAWVPVPASDAQAVDVNTWGVAALGVHFFDTQVPGNSIGESFKVWQAVRSFSGYYNNGLLLGVGYSSLDGNAGVKDHPAGDTSGIISGEWTFGAINFVRCMIDTYQAMLVATKLPNASFNSSASLPDMIAQLKADEKSMLVGVQELRTDKFGSSSILSGHRPSSPTEPGFWDRLVGMSSGAMGYLYASKRYYIPFGWMSNPIPSTASTTWGIMVNYNFNPFAYAGAYSDF